MKDKKIWVIRKEPEQPAEVVQIDNTLEAFQKEVGGYIETVTIMRDLIVVCNEDGLWQGLKENCEVDGISFCGTILLVSAKGDEFASIPSKHISMALGLIKEVE